MNNDVPEKGTEMNNDTPHPLGPTPGAGISPSTNHRHTNPVPTYLTPEAPDEGWHKLTDFYVAVAFVAVLVLIALGVI